MESTQKMVFAGDTVYLYHFEKSVKYGPRDGLKKKKKEDREFLREIPTVEDVRKRALYRAKGKIILLVNTNFGKWNDENGEMFNPVFLTLTFRDNLTDVKMANYEFTKFIQRLNHYITKEKKSYVKYVNTIEFQKRGAVHYHCILFNLPFIDIKIIEEIWGNGFVFIEKIDEANVAGLYISKYLMKSFNDERLRGEKCYFVSRNLKVPLFIRDIRDINFFLHMLPLDKPVYTTSYENVYQGQVDVFQYDLKKGDYSYEYFQTLFAMKYGPSVK